MHGMKVQLQAILIVRLIRIVGRKSSPSLKDIPIFLKVIVHGSVAMGNQVRVSHVESCSLHMSFIVAQPLGIQLTSFATLNTLQTT